MCIIEFVAYTCGHRSVPVYRPCPMTTSLHTNPVCPPLHPPSSLPIRNNNSTTGDPTSIPPATDVGGGCRDVGYAERATYAEGMCTPCARVLHANWVNIVEHEHRWMHERGACGCPVVFPALMGPRVVGLNEGRDEHENTNNNDDERKEDLGEYRQQGRRQRSADIQCGGESQTSNTKGCSKSYRTREQSTRAHGKRVRPSKTKRNKYCSDDTTSRSTNSVAPPLFEEHDWLSSYSPDLGPHGPSWKDSSTQGYGVTSASYGAHDDDDGGNQHQQPHLRVSIRLPSLYAAEWTQDHRLRHENGHCKCPISFERYQGHDPDHDDFGGGERDEKNNVEDCFTRPERNISFYRNHCIEDEPEAHGADGDTEDSEIKYLTTQSDEPIEFFIPSKLDRKKGDTTTRQRTARRSSEYQTRPRWRMAHRRSPSIPRADQHASADETAAPSPQPRAAADRWPSPTTDSENISTGWPARNDSSEESGVDGTGEMTFMERVMGPPAGPLVDASAWNMPVRFRSRSGEVSREPSRRTNNKGLGTNMTAAPQSSRGEEDFCERATHRKFRNTETKTCIKAPSTHSRLRGYNHRSHYQARRVEDCTSPARRHQESRYQRQGRRQQDHFRHEVDSNYQAESHDEDDENDEDGHKAHLPRSPRRDLPIVGFPIGAGPEGHCHAGDFSMCSLSRRMGQRS